LTRIVRDHPTQVADLNFLKALQAMCKTNPGDAGAQLPNVTCPVLVIEGSLDPDWPTPAPRAGRSSLTCPPGSVNWSSSTAPVIARTPRPPDQVLALARPGRPFQPR
jgi:hypothetical protein